MGYHPETLALSFPPYPKGGTWGLRKDGTSGEMPWSLGRWLYALKPWIGFDVWHIDPERPNTGNRQDDSCGWFDRTPGEYRDAVAQIMADQSAVQAIQNAIDRSVHQPAGYSERGWVRMTPADCLAASLMVATTLEHLRGWKLRNKGRWLVRDRHAMAIRLAMNLALNETDNLQTAENPSSFVKSIASALNRRFRPWWKHPRWHLHHWKINFDLARNLRRMVQPCATCRRPLGFGYCPTSDGRGLHHSACLGVSASVAP